MSLIRVFVSCVLALSGSAALAQVYKCVGPGGQTVYADAPCGAGARQLNPDTLNANTVDASALRERLKSGRESPPVPEPPSLPASVCPGEFEVRNLETSASSQRLEDKEREFLWAEIRRARACPREETRYTAEDWRQLRQTHAAQSSSDPIAREAARRQAEAIHGSAASRREVQRMQVERQIEAQREAAVPEPWYPPPLWRPTPPPRPSPPAWNCSGNVCSDAQGGRYDRQPDGSLMRRQDQARCTEVRGQLRCTGGFGR